MAWRTERTSQSVDLDLGDFTGRQILQGLINCGWISEPEAEALAKRAATREKNTPVFGLDMDSEEFQEAKHCIAVGRKSEALIHLERFLGREWMGRLA